MASTKNYKTPIIFDDIERNDVLFESAQSTLYKEEIEHFKKTSELYISLFSNSKRLYRDKDKLDHIQLIAIRMFQDTRAALLLTLKGLFPQAATLLRGVLESVNLIYDFKINPENEDIWFDASKNKRKELFKAGAVRKRVEESGVNKSIEASRELYKLLSDFSVHTNQESHIWYIESKDNSVFFHWAGYDPDKRSAALMLSVLEALTQGLFVLTYEDIYAHDRHWSQDFSEWKKAHLVFAKKFGMMFGNDKIQELEVKEDKIVYVGDL